jgi:hypothetical protein
VGCLTVKRAGRVEQGRDVVGAIEMRAPAARSGEAHVLPSGRRRSSLRAAEQGTAAREATF